LKIRKRQECSPTNKSQKPPAKKKGLQQTTLMNLPSSPCQEHMFSTSRGKDLWNDVLKFGNDYKKKVVEVMKTTSIIESESPNGNKIQQRQCFCPRPSEQCKKKGAPIVAKRNAGYSNFFSHLVRVLNLYHNL